MEAFKRYMIIDQDGSPIMDGNRFTHKWSLMASDSQSLLKTVEVCRDVFMRICGITKYEMDRASSTFRSNVQAVRATPLKEFKDEDIQQFDHATTRQLFLSQVIDSKTSRPIENLSENAIRCAMIPFSEKYFHANTFLQRHFEVYGDYAPNQYLVQVSCPWRHDIFVDYQKHVDSLNSDQKPMADLRLPLVEKLNFNEFTDFWASLYPNHVTRKFVNVVGKCSTCYEIDKCRQSAVDRYEQC